MGRAVTEDTQKESASRKNFLAGSNLNSIYNEIVRSTSSNVKDVRSSVLIEDKQSDLTLNTKREPKKMIQSLRLSQKKHASDSFQCSKNSQQVTLTRKTRSSTRARL